MNESLRIAETLEMDNGLLRLKQSSNRLLGIVETKVYDQSGKLLTTMKSHNDIIIPGSVFVLEQMFKTKATTRKLHPKTVDTKIPSIGTIKLIDDWSEPAEVNDELIFGFMVGNGGSGSEGVHSVVYDTDSLIDKNGSASFLPFRIVDATATEQPTGYVFKTTASGKNFYYMKAFDTTPAIVTDTAGCYVSMKMSITSVELKEYFNLASITANAGVNQIGLVAGYYDTTTGTYNDIKLVTTLNFPFHDLTGSNNMEMTYTIYSLQ